MLFDSCYMIFTYYVPSLTMNYEILLATIPNERAVINFLIEKKIVQRPLCGSGHEMILESKGANNYRWACNPCVNRRLPDARNGLRVDNWLEGSRLDVT